MCKKGIILILLTLFVYNLYAIGEYCWNSYSNNKLNNELNQQYNMTKKEENYNKIKMENQGYLAKFELLLKINQDVVGWVKIPNTPIDYPVVKTEDNDFYLHHNIKKEKSNAGTIFMDFRNEGKLKDKNTILYGHNMKDGSMFKGLISYNKQEFFNENSIIEFSDLNNTIYWEIFSVYITDTDFDYLKTDFTTDGEYEKFLEDIHNKSSYDTGITVSKDDKILTLSTCTYEFEDARLAIHAKMIK